MTEEQYTGLEHDFQFCHFKRIEDIKPDKIELYKGCFSFCLDLSVG